MTVITIPGMDQAIADLNKPAIPEGKYLAVIQGVEYRVNDRGSAGFMWNLLVNTSPDFEEGGWNPEGRTYPLKHYTYLGKIVGNGKLSDTNNSFRAAEFLAALGLNTGVVDTEEVKYRQVVVTIKHLPDDREVAAGVENPRLWPRVGQALKYEKNGEVAPKLDALAEANKSGGDGAGAADPEF